MIPVLITVVLTGMLILCYVSWVSNFEYKEKIDSIAREYLLRMGTVGCLSDEDKNMLLQELADNSLENIELQGTTLIPVESGEVVTLKIKGNFNYRNVTMNDIFSWNADGSADMKKQIEIEKSTTALY